MNVPVDLSRVREIFNAMGSETLHLCDELYAPDVVFEDPFHRVEGRNALHEYYARLYANVEAIRFDFADVTRGHDDVVLYWVMTYCHRRIAGGRPVTVQGCTRLGFDAFGQVSLHRDYFDAGEMLYEHLPLLGRGIRFIKERVG